MLIAQSKRSRLGLGRSSEQITFACQLCVTCRGYLAKGALLKQNGRKGDAQRMFIKSRFLAPPELQAVVDSLSNR